MIFQIQKFHDILFSDDQLENVAVGPCLGQLCGSLRRGQSGTKGNHQGVIIEDDEEDEDEEKEEGDEEEQGDEDQEEDDSDSVAKNTAKVVTLIQLKIIDYRASQVVVGCRLIFQ